MAAAAKSYKVAVAFTDPKGRQWSPGQAYPAPQNDPKAQEALQAAIAAGQVTEEPAED